MNQQTIIQKEVYQAVTKYLSTAGKITCSSLHQELIQQIEIPLFRCVLEHTKRNQTSAAEILGISRTTLRKKLKSYDLL